MSEQRLVATAIGSVPFEDLRVCESRTESSNEITFVREWFYSGNDANLRDAATALGTYNGHVKRDVWVTLLHGQSMTSEPGKIG